MLSSDERGQSKIISLDEGGVEDDVEEEMEEENQPEVEVTKEELIEEKNEVEVEENDKGLTSDVPDVMQLPGFSHQDQTLQVNYLYSLCGKTSVLEQILGDLFLQVQCSTPEKVRFM